MLLAELQVIHSRPIAPTRRLALGRTHLPVSPAPGFGGILLGGIVASAVGDLDPDLFDDLHRLTVQLQDGARIPQPRLGYRLQTDHVGLLHSSHRLLGEGDQLHFDLSPRPTAAQSILAAVYAAGRLPAAARVAALSTIRKAMRWSGPLDRSLVAHLSGLDRGRDWSTAAMEDPIGWAIEVLGLRTSMRDRVLLPDRTLVQRRFRDLVRAAHPDQGGEVAGAAERIAALTEARRILLAS